MQKVGISMVAFLGVTLFLGALAVIPSIAISAHAYTLSDPLIDCPGIGAIASATSGNDGSSIVVSSTIVGNTVHHLISLPVNVQLIEECVYPNGGDLSTVVSEATTVPNWTAGLNCKTSGGVNSCVHSIRNTGNDNIVGPTTNTDDLDITYTTVTGLSWIKAIHVLDNVPNNAGPCGTTGATCFVFPSGFQFPPPPTNVPEFPAGIMILMALAVPIMLLVRKVSYKPSI
jgi:hypothetical protein